METESKIGKLGKLGEISRGRDEWWIIDALNNIIEKQGEIIDHLNSQDQEEETRVRIYKDWQTPKGWVDEVTKVEVEDTQEGWKEVNKDIWYMVGGKKYVNINGEEYIRTSDLEQLLDERERWAIDTFLKDTASYNSFHNGRPRTMRNGLSGEGFEVRVSKLNKKK